MEQVKVVPIVGAITAAKHLRDLADKIDAAENPYSVRVTCIVNDDVYCWGPVADAKAAEGVVFDLTFALHKIMSLPVKRALEKDGF